MYCIIELMRRDSLTKKQEEKIARLGKCIFSEAKLFPNKEEQLLIKLPLSLLKQEDISLSEAKNLIGYLNKKVGDILVGITVLNGKIFQFEGSPAIAFKQELKEINIEDEKEYLILWIDGITELKKNFKKSFLDISDEIVSSFDKKLSKIVFGNMEINLPPAQDEFNFCRVMFNYNINEPIDWSVVWEKMDNVIDEIPEKTTKKKLLDITYRINKRIEKKIGHRKNLFAWKKNTISRNY